MTNDGINYVRKGLLSSADSKEELTMAENEMKNLISYLNVGYKDNDGKINIRKAISDMGIFIIEQADSDSIVVTGNQNTTFSVQGEPDSPIATKGLIRLLGIYLFTNNMLGKDCYEDKQLSQNDETKLNDFYVLMSIPDIDFDSFIPVQQLVKWSIELGIPLPILKSTLSL